MFIVTELIKDIDNISGCQAMWSGEQVIKKKYQVKANI